MPSALSPQVRPPRPRHRTPPGAPELSWLLAPRQPARDPAVRHDPLAGQYPMSILKMGQGCSRPSRERHHIKAWPADYVDAGPAVSRRRPCRPLRPLSGSIVRTFRIGIGCIGKYSIGFLLRRWRSAAAFHARAMCVRCLGETDCRPGDLACSNLRQTKLWLPVLLDERNYCESRFLSAGRDYS